MRERCRTIITNPPYGEAAVQEGQPRSSRALFEFLRHALALIADDSCATDRGSRADAPDPVV
jgi:hypothetical protein